MAGSISNAFGNLASGLAEQGGKKLSTMSMKALAALIGTELAPGAGTVVEFLIGVAIEQAASMIHDVTTGKGGDGEAELRGALRAGAAIQAKTAELDAQTALAIQRQFEAFSAIQERLLASCAQAEVDSIRDQAVHESRLAKKPLPNGDRSLSERMLADWVLEHAGDEEDAVDDTGESAWESARDRIYGPRDLDQHRAVTLDLASDDGAVYVDEWEYEVRVKASDGEMEREEFTVSPD